jgi:hypothetical protein
VKALIRKDKFNVEGDVPAAVWVNRQEKRITSVEKNLDKEAIVDKLLALLDYPIEYKLRNAMSEGADVTDVISHLENIVSVRKSKKLREMRETNRKNRYTPGSPENRPDKLNNKTSDNKSPHYSEITCHDCGKKGHKANKCPENWKKKNHIQAVENEDNAHDISEVDSVHTVPSSNEESDWEAGELGGFAILPENNMAALQIEEKSEEQQAATTKLIHPSKSNAEGNMHLQGGTNITNIICNKFKLKCLLDGGAFCSIVSPRLLQKIEPEWETKMSPVHHDKFFSCNGQMTPLGVIKLPIIFPHANGNVKILAELVVMKDYHIKSILLGNDYIINCGIDIINSEGRYFTIGGDTSTKFEIGITNKVEIEALELNMGRLDPLFENTIKDSKICEDLTLPQRKDLMQVLHNYKEAFATTEEPFECIKGHEVSINLSISRPYPPILRRSAYPASPRSREAL